MTVRRLVEFRWLWVSAYAIVSVATVALIFSRPPSDRLADLEVYRGAAEMVRTGGALYGFQAANGDPFTYPPFAALLMLPLTRMSQVVAAGAWTAASLAAVAALGHLVAARWPHDLRPASLAPHEPVGRGWGWALACALLVSAPGQSNLRFGQVSVFVVLLALADVLGLFPARWRGVGIGLAAAVKLTPLLFLVHLAVTGRRIDAARAATTFAAATGIGWLVLPADSATYWWSALTRTDRIGDLAAFGNQSINGMLFRAGLTGPIRVGVWALIVTALCVVALARARHLHTAGRPVHAAVLIGCATIAASPVSWTHHQFWTVLAGMLLTAAPPGFARLTGVVLLTGLTVSVTDVIARLPLGSHAVFLAANARGLAVVALCLAGFATRTPARPTAEHAEPFQPEGLASSPRPRSYVLTRRAPALTVGALLFAALPLPGGADPAAHNLPDSQALQRALGGLGSCPDSVATPTRLSEECARTLIWPGEPVNYSGGCCSSETGLSEIAGVTAPLVTRLEYIPSPGMPALPIALHPAGPANVFAFVATDTAYAQLRAYDQAGHPLGDFSAKLHGWPSQRS